MPAIRAVILFLILPVASSVLPTARADESPFIRTDSLWQAGAYREALAVLEALRAERPEDADVLWRIARSKIDLGEDSDEEDEQEATYRDALTDAEAALAADSANAHALVTAAIASGRVALASGNREKIRRSRDVQEYAERAIRIDPENDLAYHVRGRWHYNVADLGLFQRSIAELVYGGLPDASFEQALQDFRRAIDLHDRIVHRLALARTYRKLNQDAQARTHLQRAVSMPGEAPDDPRYKREAETLLREIG